MRGSLKVAVSILGGMLMAASCSSDTKTISTASAPAPTTTSADPTTVPVDTEAPASGSPALSAPIADAVATRDALLELANGSTVIPNSSPNYGALQAWEPYLAPLGFQGSGIAATPTSISGAEVVYSKSKGYSYLAFAVLDGAGHCAGGAVELEDDTTVSIVVAIDDMTAAKCSGSDASDAGGY